MGTLEPDLAELYEHLVDQGIVIDLGSSPKKPKEKVSATVAWIRQTICPKAKTLNELAETKEFELATLIADVLVAAAGGIPAPCATIGRVIGRIGLERFCRNPEALSAAKNDDE